MNPLRTLSFSHCLLLLALLASAANAQGVRFDRLRHDFGIVKQKQMRTAEFRFVNEGSDTAFLAPPRAGCGCTAALLSSSVLAPGDSGSISVQFTAYIGALGNVEKTVQVFRLHGTAEEQIATLTIACEIVGDLIPDTTMLRFQTVAGNSVSLVLHLTSNSQAPLRLDNVSFAAMEYTDTTAGESYHADKVIGRPVTDFTLRIDDEDLAQGESTTLHMTIRTHGKGQINGHVRIVLPDSELRIPVIGIVYRNRSPGE